MDRLDYMSIYIKTVELGSFAAAADTLMMSPQLVGKAVNSLERYLGVKLINRTTRHHSVTEAGQHYYAHAKLILAEIEAAESLVQQARSEPRGRLRINAPVSFGTHALAPRLPQYLQQHGEISLDLTLNNRQVDLIAEGYDAIFRVGELADSSLIAKPLVPYQLIACAAPTYLLSAPKLEIPSDLVNHECLIFAHTGLRTHWIFLAPEGKIRIPITGRLQIDSGEALLAAAVVGFGIIMQPAELVMPYLESGELVQILSKYKVPSRRLNLLYAPNRWLTPTLRSFIDFTLTHFG